MKECKVFTIGKGVGAFGVYAGPNGLRIKRNGEVVHAGQFAYETLTAGQRRRLRKELRNIGRHDLVEQSLHQPVVVGWDKV